MIILHFTCIGLHFCQWWHQMYKSSSGYSFQLFQYSQCSCGKVLLSKGRKKQTVSFYHDVILVMYNVTFFSTLVSPTILRGETKKPIWVLPDWDGSVEADLLWRCGLCFGSYVPTSNYLPSSWFSGGPKELALPHKGSGVACETVWTLELKVSCMLRHLVLTEEVCCTKGSFNYYWRQLISMLSL